MRFKRHTQRLSTEIKTLNKQTKKTTTSKYKLPGSGVKRATTLFLDE